MASSKNKLLAARPVRINTDLVLITCTLSWSVRNRTERRIPCLPQLDTLGILWDLLSFSRNTRRLSAGMKAWPLLVSLGWRSSFWFITCVVWIGLTTDLLIYTLLVPAIPFQLERLGYQKISSLAGWLLFAYSLGLVLSTPPIASLSERYRTRRLPMIAGVIVQIGSQLMFMEAPNFPVMCIARVLQGTGSSLVWVVGMALICDTTPEELIGRQLGIAMSGLTLGITIGPPIGGAMYSRFGFRGPILFGICFCVIDMVGRLFVIEKFPPSAAVPPIATLTTPKIAAQGVSGDDGRTVFELRPLGENAKQSEEQAGTPRASFSRAPSFLTVIYQLLRSPRTLTALLIASASAVIYAGPETSVILHLQKTWGLESGRVGLVFLTAAIPTLITSILSGWLTDRIGAEWVTFSYLLATLPWWILLMTARRLPVFIVAFVAEYFFASGALAPLTAELASISRMTDGVGYAHTYGAYNVFYGIGSAVGPVMIGHIYDRSEYGWPASCIAGMSFVIASLVLSFFYTGADPLYNRFTSTLRERLRTKSVNK